MRWRRPSRKACHSQIEAAPEEMHRTAFAAKARSEFLEHAIALYQNAPESIGIFLIVRAMLFIFIERDRILNLVRYLVNCDRQMKLVESPHQSPVKIGNGTRLQFNRSSLAIARVDT